MSLYTIFCRGQVSILLLAMPYLYARFSFRNPEWVPSIFLCIHFLFVMNLSGKSHLSPLIFSHSSFPVTCVTEPHVPSCDYWFTNSLSYCPLTGGLCFTHLLSGAYHTAWPWQRSWEPLCRKHWVVFSGCHDKCYSIVFSRSSQPS